MWPVDSVPAILALRRSWTFTWLVALDGAVLLAIYEFPERLGPATKNLLAVRLVTGLAPAALLATALAIGAAHLRSRQPTNLAEAR